MATEFIHVCYPLTRRETLAKIIELRNKNSAKVVDNGTTSQKNILAQSLFV
jgi:hypothetical protein